MAEKIWEHFQHTERIRIALHINRLGEKEWDASH